MERLGDPEGLSTGTAAGPASSPFRVLARRSFLPYFAGNLLSNNGTWFQNIAQVLLVYRLTGSPLWVGVVNFAQFAGILLVGPVAGRIADRVDRRRLLIGTQLTAAGIAAGLALLAATGRPAPGVVIGFALALGLATAFATPALHAIVPSLVPRRDLGSALALNAVTFNLARVTGPLLGALLVDRLGFAWAFGANACSYLSLVAGVWLARPAPDGTPLRADPDGPILLRDTLRAVARDDRLLVPLVAVAAAGASIDPVTTLSPAIVSRIYGRPDTLVGALVASFGIGAVTAAFTVAWRGRPSPRRQAAFLFTLGAGIAAFASSGSPLAGGAALATAGFGYLATATSASTLLHTSVPEEHRGRTVALWSIAFHGSRPVASFLDGALASAAGLREAGVALALPALGVGTWLASGHRREAT